MYDKDKLNKIKQQQEEWEGNHLSEYISRFPERKEEFITTSSEPINPQQANICKNIVIVKFKNEQTEYLDQMKLTKSTGGIINTGISSIDNLNK